MRRSSWIALCAAAVALCLCALLYAHTEYYSAPPMTEREARRIIDVGRDALRRRDTDAIINLFAPNAKLLDHKLDEMRPLISRAFLEIDGHLEASVRNVSARQTGASGAFTMDMDIGQKSKTMEAVYYPNLHVHVTLAKFPVTHWLGLFTTEEWKITEMTTIPLLESVPL